MFKLSFLSQINCFMFPRTTLALFRTQKMFNKVIRLFASSFSAE